jgi:chemotaxis protein histidine kinase CheA
MSDPISGGMGKAALEAMREMQQQMSQQVSQQQQADPAKFEQAMKDSALSARDLSSQQMNPTTQTKSPTNVLRSAMDQALSQASQNPAVQQHGVKVQKLAKTSTSKLEGMKKMVQELVSGQNKMDDIMKMATSGRQFSPQQMIALQAGVYRFSQELELTSKVIEKTTGSIKQTMNTQI